MITNNQMDTANDAYIEAGFAELDKRAEAQDVLEARIDTLTDEYMACDGTVEGLLADNVDVAWAIIKKGVDVNNKLNARIRHWARNLAEGVIDDD